MLTGPNNTGKSAVVEALRCLTQNPSPRHFIRHGAAEARVEVVMDDGTVVAWVRRPKYALYELTRPGAAAPEVFAKFGRTPPEAILAVLALDAVALEGGAVVDVHIGNQREPVFLLNQPGSVVAGFFAASTEAAHLIAMQNLLTERSRKGKIEKGRLEKRLTALAGEIDRLAPLPDLEMRLGEAAEREAVLIVKKREAEALAAVLAEHARLHERRAALVRARDALLPLGAPPVLVATQALAEQVTQGDVLCRQIRLASQRQTALSRLLAPPVLVDTAALAAQAAAVSRARNALSRAARKVTPLAGLREPPEPADIAALADLTDRLRDCRQARDALARRNQTLSRLDPPPAPAETHPLAQLVTALTDVHAAMAATRAAVAQKGKALAALTARIDARLQELGVCPLCGANLSAADFLDRCHDHNPTTQTP